MTSKNPFKLFLLGATALAVAACDEPKEDVFTFKDVKSCVASGQFDEETCKAEYAKAKAQNDNVAPRFNSRHSCYSDFGHNQCYHYTSSSGGSFWLPFMAGYMMAPRGHSTIVSTQPLYRPHSDAGGYYTATSTRVGSAYSTSGRGQIAKSKAGPPPPARTRTVARGGFGSRATSSYSSSYNSRSSYSSSSSGRFSAGG